ncbi:MAG: HEAT repeat domain-containing protein [Planctomycetes bacterium]|nr:HEAT repeat domain-containing protein [Planctomycetota bacterium]
MKAILSGVASSRSSFCLAVALAILPASRADDKARFEELRGRYEELARNNDREPLHERTRIMEEMGELRLAGAESFFGDVLSKDTSLAVKVQAAEALGKIGTKAAVEILYRAALSSRESLVTDTIPVALAHVGAQEEPGSYLVSKYLYSNNPAIRAATAEGLGLMGYRPAGEPLEKLLRDRDFNARYEAIRALGRVKRAEALEDLLKELESRDARFRDAACQALGELGDPKAQDGLVKALQDPAWQVREAAVIALGRLGGIDAVPALADRLDKEELRIATELETALQKITGKNFGRSSTRWLSWWKARAGGGGAAEDGDDEEKTVVNYYEAPLHTNRVIFIIDTSGSMEWGDRIGVARKELAKTIGELRPSTFFNILSFSSSPIPWEKDLVPATDPNKAAALQFVERLLPGGGTNAWDTLTDAMERNPTVDTIYFLSDGVPWGGRIEDPEKIVAEIRKIVKFSKVRIHTIALLMGDAPPSERKYDDKDAAARFMKRLAMHNGGEFIEKR